MRAVPWKGGASAPRKAHKIRVGFQPRWSHFASTLSFSAAALALGGM
jgi:hypothetical protein